MNKTKRTLIVSSVVMALIFVVTVVSVTAAWFTNVSDSNEDGFTTDSALLSESASITIDENAASDYGTAVWPAVATPGYLEKGNVAPYGTELKQAQSGTIDIAAKCAVIYFPIAFVGSSDTKTVDGNQVSIDGRKSLMLSVNSAYLDSDTENVNDYLSAFNVEMELVALKDDGDSKTSEKITSVAPNDFSDNPSAIYYNQPFTTDAKLPSYKLYMLVIPGETYYVKATIYFNQIDEECNEKLIYFESTQKSIAFQFEIKYNVGDDVDIRQGTMPA